MAKEKYRLHYNNGGTEALPLEDVAIKARIIDAKYKMCGHHSWNRLEMSINDVRDCPTNVPFENAEEALTMFAVRNGVSALVNKVVKMCVDELNASTFKTYEMVTGELMHCIGPTCVWCEDRNCAECPYINTPKGNTIRWYKVDGEVKYVKK